MPVDPHQKTLWLAECECEVFSRNRLSPTSLLTIEYQYSGARISTMRFQSSDWKPNKSIAYLHNQNKQKRQFDSSTEVKQRNLHCHCRSIFSYFWTKTPPQITSSTHQISRSNPSKVSITEGECRGITKTQNEITRNQWTQLVLSSVPPGRRPGWTCPLEFDQDMPSETPRTQSGEAELLVPSINLRKPWRKHLRLRMEDSD